MFSKKQIFIASTLKPIDDTRSYRKIGVSLAKTNKYEIKIAGFGTKNSSKTANIQFIPLGIFNRISLKRLLVPFLILSKILNFKPSVLIISTHELIIPAIFYKVIFPSSKIIYDVRENYFVNIMSQQVFPKFLRIPLAYWVRFKEHVSKSIISLYIIAEESYCDELKFLHKKRFIVLQNKALVNENFERTPIKTLRNIVFTGNLSRNSGVLKAVHLFDQISKDIPNVKLKIIGHSPSLKFLKTLQSEIVKRDSVTLIGGKSPVDHQEIISIIKKADLGIVSYQLNPSNRNCLPTKVFEYLAFKLPFICEEQTKWSDYANSYNLAFPTKIDRIDSDHLTKWLGNINYPTDITSSLWSTDEAILLATFNELFI